MVHSSKFVLGLISIQSWLYVTFQIILPCFSCQLIVTLTFLCCNEWHLHDWTPSCCEYSHSLLTCFVPIWPLSLCRGALLTDKCTRDGWVYWGIFGRQVAICTLSDTHCIYWETKVRICHFKFAHPPPKDKATHRPPAPLGIQKSMTENALCAMPIWALTENV